MHVMVATPHNRLERETIYAIFSQTYTGSLSHHFVRDNPEPVVGHNIVRAYRRLREIFLAGPYDVLWIVENDVIPPPDALDRLLAVEADIVYGVYVFRRGSPVVNIMQPGSRNPMTELPQWRRRFERGAVVDAGGLGFGCTLIRRRVLEKLEMRTEGGGGDADTCLSLDAPPAGFTQKAHLGVVCGHKRPDGVVLWPKATRPFFTRAGAGTPRLNTVEAVRPFAVWNEYGAVKIVQLGEPVAIDYELAEQLVGVGIAVYPDGGKKYQDIAR